MPVEAAADYGAEVGAVVVEVEDTAAEVVVVEFQAHEVGFIYLVAVGIEERLQTVFH